MDFANCSYKSGRASSNFKFTLFELVTILLGGFVLAQVLQGIHDGNTLTFWAGLALDRYVFQFHLHLS